MILRLGKNAAKSSRRRADGEQKYDQKRQLREKSDQQLMKRRKARVQAARSTLGSPESDAQKLLRHAHQYGHAVSKMNRERIGKPNRMKRMNRYPDPEPHRKKEKSLVMFEDDNDRKGKSGHNSHNSNNSNNSNNSRSRSNSRNQNKRATNQPSNNSDGPEAIDPSKAGWGVMYRYQAIKMGKEAEEDKKKKQEEKLKLKAYLDNQVKTKEVYFTNKAQDKAYWLKKNNKDTQEWKSSTKKIQRNLLAKNLDIKKARQVQLDELNNRRMKEKMILKEEDDQMMARQRREKKRAARQKQLKLKQQEAALQAVKVENERVLKEKQKVLEEKWKEEARLDAEWKEILDKQERKRNAMYDDIKKKMGGLETIGLAVGATMAEQLAEDDRRAKRDQMVLRKREDDKAAAVIAKKLRMKNEMIKSIDEAILLKEKMRQQRAIEDAKFAAKLKRLNNIELDKLDHADDGREAYVLLLLR